MWECGEEQTDRQTDRQTDTQTAVANIHFALAMPHAKCNEGLMYQFPSPIKDKFGMKDWTHGVFYHAKFHIDWFIVSPPPNLTSFSISQFCGGATWRRRDNVEQDAQRLTVPFPIIWKDASKFTWLNGDTAFTNFRVQGRDGQNPSNFAPPLCGMRCYSLTILTSIVEEFHVSFALD